MDIKEFSKRLGVSTTTISHAISGRRPVKPATRQLIMEKMAEWNYTPNVNARRLVKSRTNMVAFFSDASDTLADPYQLELTRHFCRMLRKHGYDLLLDLYHDEETDRYASLRQRVKSRAVDGSIIIGTAMPETDFAAIASEHCPCVYIDNTMHAPCPNVAFVIVDCGNAYAEAMQCLKEMGRSRIAFVARHEGDPQLDLWREMLPRYGLTVPKGFCVYSAESSDDARDAILPLLLRPDRPQAVIARTDAQAHGVLKAAHETGIAVPDGLSIIGHGDIHYSRQSDPPLATVSFDYRRLGESAVEALFGLMRAPGTTPEPVIFPGRFLARGTLL